MGAAPCDAPGAYAAACPTRSGLAPLLARSDLLVATGDADDDVPPDLSRAFAAAARAAAPPGRAAAYVEVPGADHYAVMDAAAPAFAAIWDAAEAMLARRAAT